jgi:hypothetical protein
MNNQQNRETDPLSRYIDPNMIEKAPAGFTLKVMENIRLEAMPAGKSRILNKIKPVPAISLAVTISLIIAALLLSGGQNDPYAETVNESLRNIKLSLPEVDLTPFFKHNLPEVLIWVLGGIIILSVFDRALSTFIRKL